MVAVTVTGHFIGRYGAPSDKAHISLQHVDELRQLVQAGPSENPADASHTRVIGELESRAATVRGRCGAVHKGSNIGFVSRGTRLLNHSPEFVHREIPHDPD